MFIFEIDPFMRMHYPSDFREIPMSVILELFVFVYVQHYTKHKKGILGRNQYHLFLEYSSTIAMNTYI